MRALSLLRTLGLCLSGGALAYGGTARAQTHDGQVWTTVSASADLTSELDLQLEWVSRFSDGRDGLYEMEFGGMLGLELDGGIELSAGYVRVPGYSRSGPDRVESRPRQQISFSSGGYSGRLRLEQRFRSDGDDIGVRLRPQIGWSLPLAENGTSLRLSHESFIGLNATDWGQQSGYERMRNAAAIRAPLADGVSVEGGYLNQYSLSRGGEDEMAHVLTLGLSFGF